MAEQVNVWKAADGSYWSSEAQALAYEMKLWMINLGKSAVEIKVNAEGKIDGSGMGFLATGALSSLKDMVETLTRASDA